MLILQLCGKDTRHFSRSVTERLQRDLPRPRSDTRCRFRRAAVFTEGRGTPGIVGNGFHRSPSGPILIHHVNGVIGMMCV